MKMEDGHKEYWSALAKYFSGNASDDEKILVHEKRKQDKKFNDAYRQAERLWRQPSIPAGEYEPDVEGGWQRLKMKTGFRKEPEPQEGLPQVPVQKSSYAWTVAASIVFLLTMGFWFINLQDHTDWVEVQTARNEIRKIALPDGSMVSLNENSIFSYPAAFQEESREVKLKGEAFFKVQKAEGKRFTVIAGNTKTEVIGTAFYLKAYTAEEVRIQVTEGKVAFAGTATGDAVFLSPGQEAVMVKNQMVPVKQEIEDVNFQAWESKKLVFENMELGQIVSVLEQYFSTSIIIEYAELKNCRFTASFRDPELEEVLEILSITGGLTISKKGDRIVISGNTCQ